MPIVNRQAEDAPWVRRLILVVLGWVLLYW